MTREILIGNLLLSLLKLGFPHLFHVVLKDILIFSFAKIWISRRGRGGLTCKVLNATNSSLLSAVDISISCVDPESLFVTEHSPCDSLHILTQISVVLHLLIELLQSEIVCLSKLPQALNLDGIRVLALVSVWLGLAILEIVKEVLVSLKNIISSSMRELQLFILNSVVLHPLFIFSFLLVMMSSTSLLVRMLILFELFLRLILLRRRCLNS